MAYTPENNPYIPGDPYSYDLKWLVDKIKSLFSNYEGLKSDLEALKDYVNTLSVENTLKKIILDLVNDGTISALLAGIDFGFVSPEMYGAKGDGITDDTAALQDAINAAITLKAHVLLIKTYLIDDTINIPGDIAIYGLKLMEYDTPSIYVGSNVNILFNVTHAGCIFSDFRIVGTKFDGAYRILQNYIAFAVSGSENNYNADAKFSGMEIGYAEAGIWGTGRNIHVDDCLISHCRYGIHFEKLSNITAYRGMRVTNCRFHGIGEEMEISGGAEQEILIGGNCAGVLLDLDDGAQTSPQVSSVQIEGNYSDQGGPLVKGAAQFLSIIANTVFTFYTPAIIIASGTTSHTPSSGGSITILSNSFYGNYGTDAIGTTHEHPEYAIKIEHINRITIGNNNFAGYRKAVIYVNNAEIIGINANNINYLHTAESVLLEAYNSNNIILQNNINATGNIHAAIIGTGNLIRASNNYNFSYDPAIGTLTPIPESRVKIADIVFNETPIDLTIASKFILRRTDGVAIFEITKREGGYSSTLNTTPTYCQWIVFNDNIPRILRYTYNTKEITYVDSVPGYYEIWI